MSPNATDKPQQGVKVPLALVVAALATLAPFTIDTYLPSFPDIAKDFSASHAQMQLTLSLYLLASAVATLVYGPLSDGFGRRKVIMFSLVIYMLASVGCVLSVNIDQLILLRVMQGLSASAGMVIGRAMIRDVYQGEEARQVMAKVMLLFAVAPAVAPVIGGLLHDLFGWRAVFLFLAFVAFLLAVMIGLGTEETLTQEHRQSVHPLNIVKVYLRALMHRHFMMLSLSFAMMFSGFFVYVAGAPAVIYDFLKLGVNDFWVIFVPSVAAIMAGSVLSGKMAKSLSQEKTVWVGFGLMIGSALLNVAQSFFFEPMTFLVVAPLGIYVLGMAIAMPNMSLMAIDCFPHHKGMASALQSFVQMGFTALVVGAVVPMVVFTLSGMTLAMFALVGIGSLLWMLRGQHT